MNNYCGLPPNWDDEKNRKDSMKRHYLQTKWLEGRKNDWNETYLKPKDKKNEKPISKEEWNEYFDSLINQELKGMSLLMTKQEIEECLKISNSLKEVN